ncbi:MAG: thioredoxin [Verrucomicrobiota bacterium]
MSATVLNSDSFKETLTNSEVPVLIDFYADWCGPCKMLGPVIDKIAEQQGGEAVVAKVDIQASPDLAREFQITSIPALMVFKNGEAVESARGVQSEAAIEAMLDRARSAATA